MSAIANSYKKGRMMETTVSININTSPEKIWEILTNGPRYTSWNSTVISLEGNIKKGEKIKLTSTSDPKRVFKLNVVEFDSPTKMVWSDGNFMFKGVRTFSLDKKSDGSTDFKMTEVFSGLMLPLIAKSLPDFKPYFQKFAEDLKVVAENS